VRLLRSWQVLNVDGCIGALFLDLLASSGAFTKKVRPPHLSLSSARLM
jgi:hypothetical protein